MLMLPPQGVKYYERLLHEHAKQTGDDDDIKGRQADVKGRQADVKGRQLDPAVYCHLGHLHLLLEDFPKGELGSTIPGRVGSTLQIS